MSKFENKYKIFHAFSSNQVKEILNNELGYPVKINYNWTKNTIYLSGSVKKTTMKISSLYMSLKRAYAQYGLIF